MGEKVYLKKIVHESLGEVYQFIKLYETTGKEQVMDSLETEVFREAVLEPLPDLFSISSKRGANASGYFNGDYFVVQKGSKFASSTSPKCPERYIHHRERLILDKLLMPLHNQLLVMEDIKFDNPATAMGVAIGGWVKGAHGWKEQEKK